MAELEFLLPVDDNEFEFKIGETVLVYYKTLIYEAKCLKRRKLCGDIYQYFVHYIGWKHSWDEWVDSDVVLCVNQTNIDHMYRVFKAQGLDASKPLEHRHSTILAKMKNESKKKLLIQMCEEKKGNNIISCVQSTKSKSSLLHTITQSTVQSTTNTISSPTDISSLRIVFPVIQIEPLNLPLNNITRKQVGSSQNSSANTTLPSTSTTSISNTFTLINEETLLPDISGCTNTSTSLSEINTPEKNVLQNGYLQDKQFEAPAYSFVSTTLTSTSTTLQLTNYESLSPVISRRINDGASCSKTSTPSEVFLHNSYMQNKQFEATAYSSISTTLPSTSTTLQLTNYESLSPVISSRINDGASCSKTTTLSEVFLNNNKVIGSTLNSLDNTIIPSTYNKLMRTILPQNNQIINLIRIQQRQHKQLSDDNTVLSTSFDNIPSMEFFENNPESLSLLLDNIKSLNNNIDISDIYKIIFHKNVKRPSSMTIGILPDINVPTTLRKIIYHDFVLVTHHKKISEFPEEHTISNIVQEYILYKLKSNDILKDKAANFGLHVLDFFNYSLHKYLLYQVELDVKIETLALKHFLSETINKDKNIHILHKKLLTKKIWCYVYSPVYLLRLIAILPSFANHLSYDQKDLNCYIYYIHDFLFYLEKHYKKFFITNNYIPSNKLKTS